MKAVLEEVMGLRRGEGDEKKGRFLAESDNRAAGKKEWGGVFLAPSALEAKIYLLLVSISAPIYEPCERREKAVYHNNKRMRDEGMIVIAD